MNMTKIGEYDLKIDNDECKHMNLIENVINITTTMNVNQYIYFGQVSMLRFVIVNFLVKF